MRARSLWLIAFASCGPAAEPTTPAISASAAVSVSAPVPVSASVSVSEPPPPPPPRVEGPIFESGFASWYGAALAGHKTASGEIFDPSLLTAAHRTLKLGTWVEVRRTDTGKWVRVKVNDRGPVSHRFVIDLSSGAARELGMLKMGVAPVELRLVR